MVNIYVFVVDVHYPKKLLDKDFEFPLLCDQSIPPNDKVKNLMSTFYDKKNYTISLHMLKSCLRKVLRLKKIHQVIYAKQSNFMKSAFLLIMKKQLNVQYIKIKSVLNCLNL